MPRVLPLYLPKEVEDDVSPQTTPPHTPPSADTYDVLRKSSRLGPDKKRSYKGMQSRHSRARRPHNKFKYSFREVPSMCSTINGSYTDSLDVPARKESISKATTLVMTLR